MHHRKMKAGGRINETSETSCDISRIGMTGHSSPSSLWPLLASAAPSLPPRAPSRAGPSPLACGPDINHGDHESHKICDFKDQKEKTKGTKRTSRWGT